MCNLEMGTDLIMHARSRTPSPVLIISLRCTQVPEGIDSRAVIEHAMSTYDLEIATGLPPIGGSAWRVGLLGYNAHAANVALVVQAFREGLAAQGYC